MNNKYLHSKFSSKVGLTFLMSFIFIFTIANLKSIAQTPKAKAWVAPANSNQLKNPLAGNTSVLKDAKKNYEMYCTPCHGTGGKGDGAAAATLNPKPADHTSAVVQSQTDGALFWKLSEGRGNMAAYKQILTDEKQRWALVNYIRTLKKK